MEKIAIKEKIKRKASWSECLHTRTLTQWQKPQKFNRSLSRAVYNCSIRFSLRLTDLAKRINSQHVCELIMDGMGCTLKRIKVLLVRLFTLFKTAVARSCSYFFGSKTGNGSSGRPGTPEKSMVLGRFIISSHIPWMTFFSSWCETFDGIGPTIGRPAMTSND